MIRLHFLNVENGDCIILEYVSDDARSFGLIDCNRTPSRFSPARDKLIELGAEKLEFVCITHPDKDHYTGILDVLEHFHGRIGAFMTFPLASLLTDEARLKKYAAMVYELADLAEDDDIAARHLEFVEILVHAKQNFLPNKWVEISGDYDRLGITGFGSAEFYGISPPRKMRGAITAMVLGETELSSIGNNDVSVAIQITYAGRKIILGGDTTNANWQWHRDFRKKINLSISAEVVKLPHHGSEKDNSSETLRDFFDGGHESIAVISANGRGHPDFQTIDHLNNYACHRLCTNLFNPNESSLRRIYSNEALSTRFKHHLNVYSTPQLARAQPCKGDITIQIGADGSVKTFTEHNTLCPCTKMAEGVPYLPSLPALA